MLKKKKKVQCLANQMPSFKQSRIFIFNNILFKTLLVCGQKIQKCSFEIFKNIQITKGKICMSEKGGVGRNDVVQKYLSIEKHKGP